MIKVKKRNTKSQISRTLQNKYLIFKLKYAISQNNKFLYNKIASKYPRLNNYFNVEGLNKTYNFLSDNYSKDLLIKIVAFRMLTKKEKCGLPQDNIDWQEKTEDIKNTAVEKECYTKTLRIAENEIKYCLDKYNLNINNSNINILANADCIYLSHPNYLSQYSYNDIIVTEGDYVIDGGAYIGDTALFFAALAGKTGKVFAFEFEPENVSIFKQNMELNKELSERIILEESALWDNSDEILHFNNNGPASYCSLEEKSDFTMKVNTVDIDNFVSKNKIEKIDFIKFDIERAELKALEGAKETIKKFKPKLAICVYHYDSDFINIPKYLKELIPDYEMYLNHYTQGEYETVLYAKCRN